MSSRKSALVLLVLFAGLGAGWWTVRHARAGEAPESGALQVAASFAPTMSQLDFTDQQIALHERRAEEDPRSALDRTALAGLYLQRSREGGGFEDYRRAEEYARESLAIRVGDNSRAARLLSASLLAQHRFTEALEVAQELVRIWPESPAHRALLAEIQMELGNYDAARVILGSLEPNRENLAVAPRFARWAEVSGNLGEERRLLYGAAERAAYEFDLPREQVAWFHLRVAEHELRNGRLREAEEAVRAGLAQEPNDFRLVSVMVRVEAHRRNWERAIEYGKLVGDAADLRTLAAIGDAYAEMGDAARAEEYYRKVEESAAENPEPFNRQWTQFRLDHGRKIPETLALLQEEIATRKDVLGYDMLAWALYRSGRYAEARDAMEQALRMGTRDATFYFHAGMIERALGNDEAAQHYLRKALKVNKHFHPTHSGIAEAVLDSIGGKGPLGRLRRL